MNKFVTPYDNELKALNISKLLYAFKVNSKVLPNDVRNVFIN